MLSYIYEIPVTLHRMTVMYNIVRDRIHWFFTGEQCEISMITKEQARCTIKLTPLLHVLKHCGSTTYSTLSIPHAEAKFLDVIGTKKSYQFSSLPCTVTTTNGFYPPPPPSSKSGLKLFCKVNIACIQKPQLFTCDAHRFSSAQEQDTCSIRL
jgi:hypothetical protein